MSDLSLFLAGVAVTIIWALGIALILFAAYQDGKEEKRRKEHLQAKHIY